MDIPYHGLICRDCYTDRGRNVVGAAVAEFLDKLLSVPDREPNIEIFECQTVSCLGEVCW